MTAPFFSGPFSEQ